MSKELREAAASELPKTREQAAEENEKPETETVVESPPGTDTEAASTDTQAASQERVIPEIPVPRPEAAPGPDNLLQAEAGTLEGLVSAASRKGSLENAVQIQNAIRELHEKKLKAEKET